MTASVSVGSTTSGLWSVTTTGSTQSLPFTGTNHTVVVPAGVTSVAIKAWAQVEQGSQRAGDAHKDLCLEEAAEDSPLECSPLFRGRS